MSRRHFLFDCQEHRLAGTLDEAGGDTGFLIVSGGNEVRCGAWDGQALLAARIAHAGFPVFRFDRRGIGDSEGVNMGYSGSAPDIAAALAAFRSEAPHLRRVVAFGNCDAASALMLSGGAGFDALILANPWTLGDAGTPPPPAVLRDHYRRRLSDPRAVLRLLSGKVSLRALLSSLRKASVPSPREPATLANAMAENIADFAGNIRFLIAGRDATALSFIVNWQRGDPRIRECAGASHSFVEPQAQTWLEAQVLEVLHGQA